jgi:hypothetical protein
MRTVCAPTFVGAPGGSSAWRAESGAVRGLSSPRRAGADHPEDAVANMTVIDAIYRAAGQPLRQPSAGGS